MRKKDVKKKGEKHVTLRHCRVFNLLFRSATRTVPSSSQESPRAFQNIQCYSTDLNACGDTSVIGLAPSKRRGYD